MRISVSSQRNGGVLTVAVSGEIDIATAPEVEEAIVDAVHADGVTEILVDLSGVAFMDSSGIALLLRGRNLADERGLVYRVGDAQGVTRQVLEITGVWGHLVGDSGSGQPTTS